MNEENGKDRINLCANYHFKQSNVKVIGRQKPQ